MEHLYDKVVSTIKGVTDHEGEDRSSITNSHIIKGGLIGIIISALVRINMGKYSRLGTFKKRWGLVRNFIMPNKKPHVNKIVTDYYTPSLDIPAKNFMCYSGEAGIGKSTHFMNLAYE